MKNTLQRSPFSIEAERILNIAVEQKVHGLGGYGPGGEVIYFDHPVNCPSVLVDSDRQAKATFMSNGSVGFEVKLENGMDIRVLDSHYDIAEKRETGVPSTNVWIHVAAGRQKFIASLMNPAIHVNCPAVKIKLVKQGDPDRSYWYCSWFKPAPGIEFVTVVKLVFMATADGPAVSRDIYVKNLGRRALAGQLFTYCQLHGTQRFVYNKELWYDMGLPVSKTDIVMNANVPYSDVLQIKRLSSRVSGARAVSATCDHLCFVGKTTNSAALPQAVLDGKMLKRGAGEKLNRFATAAIGANQFALRLAKMKTAEVNQSLLYVQNRDVTEAFRTLSSYDSPSYSAMSRAFRNAAGAVVAKTLGPLDIMALRRGALAENSHPEFEVHIPEQKVVSFYANSAWMTVKELYENCRAHGAKMADGIELGTRDRGQDMWPKLKEDPARVRADLIHVMGMMYWTTDEKLDGKRNLTLPEKLHGMFPRQYPSAWIDRSKEVLCDNRPYADSPLWLINAIMMYIRETGDDSILLEEVTTVRLTNPEDPIHSGIIGHSRRQTLLEAVLGSLHGFERLADDSPYGMAQIMYGDWCDPIDMYGVDEVGDASRRGRGRGVQARLSGHLFLTLVETIDMLKVAPVAGRLQQAGKMPDVRRLEAFAGRLRKNTVRWAFENDADKAMPGFVSVIHEKRKDNSVPDYAAGEKGYTLGSMRGKDFDGFKRRELAAQAYGLEMLATRRDYLSEIPESREMIRKILHTIDHLFYHPKLGLLLFTVPIPNNKNAIRLVGRMGVVPSGCAENGEYHHGQIMMHCHRLSVPGQTDTAWRNFKPMISAMRDEGIAGPFETPCTSYVSDKDDPHFGKAMYFGLSGSIDWIVEYFHKIAGLRLALHDPAQPALSLCPDLPAELKGRFGLKRYIHRFNGKGYEKIPLNVQISREGTGAMVKGTRILINGVPSPKAEVLSLAGLSAVDIRYTYLMGK